MRINNLIGTNFDVFQSYGSWLTRMSASPDVLVLIIGDCRCNTLLLNVLRITLRVQSALERIMFHAYRAILSRQKAKKQMHCQAISITFCWFWCRKQVGKHKGYNVSLHICSEIHLMLDTMAGTFLHYTEQLAVTPWHVRHFTIGKTCCSLTGPAFLSSCEGNLERVHFRPT